MIFNKARTFVVVLFLSSMISTVATASPEKSREAHDIEEDSDLETSLQIHPEREISFEGAIGYSNPSAYPYGFQQKDLAPPFRLEFKAEPLVEFTRHFDIWVDGGLYFLHSTLAPVVEVATGTRWNLRHFYFAVGGQVTDQSLATEGSSGQSQFNTTYYGVVGTVGYVLPNWDFSLRTKLLFYHDTPVQSYEGIETDIAHESTQVFSPTVNYFSNFGLNALAGIDVYQFGKTAVASKEFGFGIKSGTTVRVRTGLSYLFKPFEIKAEARFVLGSPDPLELSNRAIFLGDDYLLSPTVIYLGAAWHF